MVLVEVKGKYPYFIGKDAEGICEEYFVCEHPTGKMCKTLLKGTREECGEFYDKLINEEE